MATAKKISVKKVTKTAKKTAVKKRDAKNTTAKKVVVKKAISKQKKSIRNIPKMKNAPANKCFWVNNGAVLKNLKDLHAELLAITSEQYAYHTQNGANHFAMWVDVVLSEPDCAKALKKARTQKAAAKKVAETLEKYTPPKKK
jgi:hypothetical protein